MAFRQHAPLLMIRRVSRWRYWWRATIGGIAMAGTVSAVRVAGAHPLHMTNTQVELSRDQRKLAVTVRIFTDDLETALKRVGHSVVIGTSPAALVDSALSAYLGERLQFSLDQRPTVRGKLTGHKRETEATVISLEVSVAAAPSRLVIVQQVMIELFADQSNLVYVRIGDKKRSAILNRGSTRAEFVL